MSAVPSRARMGPVSVWLMAARPATLSAAVVPILVGIGAAVHDAAFRPLALAATLAAAVLIQIGTNLANDVSDFERGADDHDRMGPPRVTQSGLVSPTQMKVAMALSFGASAATGLYLTWVGGWPILVVGALAIVAGIAYTGGPWPYGYHGLGEPFVFVFFGVVAVTGTYYLQTDAVTALAVAASLPVAMTVTAILVVNNLRDIESDRRAGKRTLAAMLGAWPTRAEYVLLVVLPFALVAGFAGATTIPSWSMLSWLALPPALALGRSVIAGTSGRELNHVLKRTSQLHLVFGTLLALGLAL